MKVLLCITGLNKGGAEKNFAALCTQPILRGYQFSPIVVSWIDGYYLPILREANIPVFVLLKPAHSLLTLRNIAKYFVYLLKHRCQFDVVQAFMPHGGLLGIFSNAILRKPFIYCIRTSLTNSLCLNQNSIKFHKNPLRWLIRNAAHFLSMHFASVVTCNTPYVKELIDKKIRKDVRVIFNGIEKPNKEKYYDNAVRTSFYNDPNCYHIVSICNMRHPKDILTLLRVAKELHAFRFVLVGDGESLAHFQSEALKLKLENAVFTGAYENIFPFLSYADQYILLTRHEGFPNTILEAMISKVPVIMSDIQEINGILRDEENCLLVKNGDIGNIAGKIVALKKNLTLSQRIVENAYSMVTTRFTMSHFVDRNYQIYRSLASSSDGFNR